jgi:hypothetical protein
MGIPFQLPRKLQIFNKKTPLDATNSHPENSTPNQQVVALTRKALPVKDTISGSSYLTTNRYYFQVRHSAEDGSVNHDAKFSRGVFVGDFGANTGTGVDTTISHDILSGIALDIPPQSLQFSNPFAINVSATNGGILEEHNGIVFRNITISGNTGVYVKRGSQISAEKSTANKILTSLFPSALNAFGALSDQLKKFNGDKPVSVISGDNDDMAVNGGAASFWRLHNFFIAYAELKKRKVNQNVRLVFGCPKDGIEYVCTPLSFDWKRSATDPLIYNYSIQLKAWDISNSISIPTSDILSFNPDDPNQVKDMLKKMIDARNTMLKAKNVLLGVNNDVGSVLNVFAQGIGVLKDASGVAYDVLDFPTLFKANVDSLIFGSAKALQSSLGNLRDKGDERIGNISDFIDNITPHQPFKGAINNGVVTATGISPTFASSKSSISMGKNSATGEGSKALASSQTLDAKSAYLKTMDSIPEAAADMTLDKLTIPDALQEELDTQIANGLNTTSGEIRRMVSDLQNTSDNLSASIGLMDAQYAKTYGLPAPTAGRAPTEDDIILMAAIQEAKQGMTETLATGELFVEQSPDPYLASRRFLSEDDDIPTPTSSYPITLNNKEDIQQLNKRILGDVNRWREIAILNDLRAPYIEQELQHVSFGSPSGRTVLVSDSSNLTINQMVTVSGSFTTQRRIVNIEDLGGTFRVTVDGIDNLTSINSTDNRLIFRSNGTLGPGDTILIPSDETVDTQHFRNTSLSVSIPNAEKVFEIDMAVDDRGDFIVGPDNDIMRRYGYANAEQAIQIALSTERGELEQYPDYGMSIPIGSRTSDVTAADIKQGVSDTILADPRFTDVNIVTTISGSQVDIGIVARGARGTGLLPMWFKAGLTS